MRDRVNPLALWRLPLSGRPGYLFAQWNARSGVSAWWENAMKRRGQRSIHDAAPQSVSTHDGYRGVAPLVVHQCIMLGVLALVPELAI